MAGLVPAIGVLLNGDIADGGKRGEGRRFLDVLSSGHPGEILSELLQEYALLRRLIFAALMLPFALYGNWNMTLGIAGIWALYESHGLADTMVARAGMTRRAPRPLLDTARRSAANYLDEVRSCQGNKALARSAGLIRTTRPN